MLGQETGAPGLNLNRETSDERVMTVPLGQTWDLDVFFPGGSKSPELLGFLGKLEADMAALRRQVIGGQVPGTSAEAKVWAQVLDQVQDLSARLGQVGSFVECLTSQDVQDRQAVIITGRIHQLRAEFQTVMTLLDDVMLQIPDPVWESLLASPEREPIAFPLEERRRRAREKLGPDMESLISDLSVDGYHGWGELYTSIVGRIRIPYQQDGETVQLSVGQAANKLSSSDRDERAAVFEQWEEAWAQEADLCAAALNRLAGYRLNLYRHRGWDQVLKEPLDMNRMQEATLYAMWNAVERNKELLVQYLHRKAKLLGVEALSWFDMEAPLFQSEKQVSYDEAASFIVEQFGAFDPQLGSFANQAFENGWIEAEDRPGKRPGGFCTDFPLSGQSRIFMTYGGTPTNVATLAHELGHAYHQWVIKDLPYLAQGYAMNVAETASTFAERIVADAALRRAGSREEQLALLAQRAEDTVSFFMNIHARFLFETRFYEERKQGMLSSDQLCQLMEQSQRDAYQGALDRYDPYFWASKLHFYITEQPFYNFPYTFGFLFSSGVYARALQDGPSFARKYVALLRDTGRMTVEELAQKHLGVDLTHPEFWQSAVEVNMADIRKFLRLTE